MIPEERTRAMRARAFSWIRKSCVGEITVLHRGDPFFTDGTVAAMHPN